MKKKIIALVLGGAMLLMGAGYAAVWSETVTINNTVQNGELKVEFIDDFDHPRVKGSLYMTYGVTHGAKTTWISMENMYPGSTAFYETHIENLGSIPAVLNDVSVNFSSTSSEVLKDKIMVWGMVVQKRPGQALPVTSKYIRKVPLRNLETALETAMEGLNLNPGDYITFDVTDEEFKLELAANLSDYDIYGEHSLFFDLPKTAGNEVENQKAEFEIVIDFKQFNK